MAQLSNWFRKSAEKLTEVLLGSDLQSRLCAYIDMVCAQRSDKLLPTRFRIEVDQDLFYQKLEEYRALTKKDLPQLEADLAEAARNHILGKGVRYRTYADTITVKLEPHVMTRGVKIIGDFPKEKKDATPIGAKAVARAQSADDQKLSTVARPVATTFDRRSLETVVIQREKPAALETRVFDPAAESAPPTAGRKPPREAPPRSSAASLETRVVDSTESPPPKTGRPSREATPPPSGDAGMETRIWSPEDDADDTTSGGDAGLETRVVGAEDDGDDALRTRVYDPNAEAASDDRAAEDDTMATRVAPTPTRILYRVVLLEPDDDGEYEETESWMLELGNTYTIGRSRANDIVIDSGTISRKHAQISLNADGDVILEDAGSSHGTFLNGDTVTAPTVVSVGDDIQLTRLGAAHLTLQPMQI